MTAAGEPWHFCVRSLIGEHQPNERQELSIIEPLQRPPQAARNALAIAVQAGATDDEIYETIDVAIEMGGGQAGMSGCM